MKKRKKSHVQLEETATNQALALAETQTLQLANYDGANVSSRRSQIHWTTLDRRKEISNFSRQELIRRARWAYANQPFITGLINAIARIIGSLTPDMDSPDLEFNAAIEERFQNLLTNAAIFDISGKFNLRTAQIMLSRCARIDGDILIVLTYEPKTRHPLLAFYESHQLQNPRDSDILSSQKWIDGVLVDKKTYKHLAYSVADDEGKCVIIPAASCIYFGEFGSVNHHRAIPPMAPALNHVLDITEITSDTKLGIKNAMQIGFVRTRDTDSKSLSAGRAGMPGQTIDRIERNRSGVSISKDSSSESPSLTKMQVQEITMSGFVADLDKGEDVKVLHDSRPSPNMQNFLENLRRDVSICNGFLLEQWYKSDGSGPSIRQILETSNRTIWDSQTTLEDVLRKICLYFIACDIQNGTLPRPKENASWMKIDFYAQPDLSIDRGRDSRARLEEINIGASTIGEWTRTVAGKSGKSTILSRIKEVKYAKEECEKNGLDYHVVFPRPAGSAPVPESTSSK